MFSMVWMLVSIVLSIALLVLVAYIIMGKKKNKHWSQGYVSWMGFSKREPGPPKVEEPKAGISQTISEDGKAWGGFPPGW